MKSVVTLDDVQDDVEQVSTRLILPFLIFNPAATVSVPREHRLQEEGRCSANGGRCRGEEEAGVWERRGWEEVAARRWEEEGRKRGGGGRRWRPGGGRRRELGFAAPPPYGRPPPYGPWASPMGLGLAAAPLGPHGRNPSWACWPKAQAQSLKETAEN